MIKYKNFEDVIYNLENPNIRFSLKTENLIDIEEIRINLADLKYFERNVRFNKLLVGKFEFKRAYCDLFSIS